MGVVRWNLNGVGVQLSLTAAEHQFSLTAGEHQLSYVVVAVVSHHPQITQITQRGQAATKAIRSTNPHETTLPSFVRFEFRVSPSDFADRYIRQNVAQKRRSYAIASQILL